MGKTNYGIDLSYEQINDYFFQNNNAPTNFHINYNYLLERLTDPYDSKFINDSMLTLPVLSIA